MVRIRRFSIAVLGALVLCLLMTAVMKGGPPRAFAAEPAAQPLADTSRHIAGIVLGAKETWAKTKLALVRRALAAYCGYHLGKFPTDIRDLSPKYIWAMPVLNLPGTGHKPTSEVRVLMGVKDEADLRSRLQDSGKWLYVADPESPLHGRFLIDCTRVDSDGRPWHEH